MNYFDESIANSSTTNYRWFVEREWDKPEWNNGIFKEEVVKSCDGCIYQSDKNESFIKPKNKTDPLLNVPLKCHDCYTWSVVDGIRNNYKKFVYSENCLKGFINEIFKDEKL